jgi:NADH-quinone oxidoreductase subunit N
MAVPPGDNALLFRILALLAVINAAIGAWYYLRIIAVMYLRTSIRPVEKRRGLPGLATLWICALLTVGLGFNPGSRWMIEASRAAAVGAEVAKPRIQE